MSNLYRRRLLAISGEAANDDDDRDGYSVFGGVAADAWSLIVASCVLAASVVIWEACAFAAMAAALVAGATWCLSIAAASREGTEYSAPTPGHGGASGLAEVDIARALPASTYQQGRAASAGGATTTCSVCLEEVRGGEMVRSLPECGHLFHVVCIDPWLHSHVTCPLCRFDLSPRGRVTEAAAAGLQGALPSPRLPSL